MKIAHVRERTAPAGAPWRLAAALDADGTRWLDLEEARRSLVAREPSRAHNSALFRQPVTTLDAHLASGLRVDALADLLDADADEPMDASVLAFGPADPGAAHVQGLLRLRAARRDDVEATRHGDPRGLVPPADLLLQQRQRDARAGRPGVGAARVERAGLRARGRRAHRHAGSRPRRGARRRRDRRLHDPQRLERPRPPARGDDGSARAGEGQGLRFVHRSVAGDLRTSSPTRRRRRATTWP